MCLTERLFKKSPEFGGGFRTNAMCAGVDWLERSQINDNLA